MLFNQEYDVNICVQNFDLCESYFFKCTLENARSSQFSIKTWKVFLPTKFIETFLFDMISTKELVNLTPVFHFPNHIIFPSPFNFSHFSWCIPCSLVPADQSGSCQQAIGPATSSNLVLLVMCSRD